MGYIPCDEVLAAGSLRYHVIATDVDGQVIASIGSPDEPLVTQIGQRAPAVALPGKPAPERCVGLLKETDRPADARATGR